MSRVLLVALLVIAVVGTSLAGVAKSPKTKVTAATASNSDGKRIVGGQEADITKYPYQVSVRLDTYTYLHICGGSIYAPRVIITAAHCIKGRFASYIRIVAGSSTIADTTDEGVRVTKLIYHPGYNKNTHENDVGLIILAEPLTYSASVQPIPLASDYPAAGTNAIITGWGKRDEDDTALPSLLREAEIQIVDHDECSTKYLAKSYTITEQMLCAAAADKDTCQGDSGGPLAVDGKLSGIVSWGIGCAHSDYPGVYASVTYHSQWIQENAQSYM